jgi:hypothetical protein
MNVVQSILLLLSVALAVAFPLFFGGALALGSVPIMVLAFACLGAAALLIWVQVKRIRPPRPYL